MDLSRTTIAVRERRLPELYDLALLVLRQHPWRLPLVGLLGIAPWALLDAWLVWGGGPDGWVRGYWLLVLVGAQIPLATAPIAAYLGLALFEQRATVAQALREGWAATPRLLPLALLRGVFCLLPLLLLFWPGHAAEVVVLERQGLRTSWRRSQDLRSVAGSDTALHLLLAAALLPVCLWFTAGTIEFLAGLFLYADPWTSAMWDELLPGRSLVPHLAVWLLVGYLAVVRFLAYIDLRTRHEGWELTLALRSAAGRL